MLKKSVAGIAKRREFSKDCPVNSSVNGQQGRSRVYLDLPLGYQEL
jgi:hypothetical protein